MMPNARTTSAPKSGLVKITLVGLAAFGASFAVLVSATLAFFSPAISQGLLIAASAIVAAVFGQLSATATAARYTQRQRHTGEQIRRALNSMPHGLSMFDGEERLVVCNALYYSMYDLSPDDVKTGTTLSDVLARRVLGGDVVRQ